jgi:hypothetical protein
MRIPILPNEIRVVIWDLAAHGNTNKQIFDLILEKAAPYVNSEEQLTRCIGSIVGQHTKGYRPHQT